MTVIGWLSAPKPPIATVIPSLILDAASSIDVTTSLRFLLTLPSSMEIGRADPNFGLPQRARRSIATQHFKIVTPYAAESWPSSNPPWF